MFEKQVPINLISQTTKIFKNTKIEKNSRQGRRRTT